MLLQNLRDAKAQKLSIFWHIFKSIALGLPIMNTCSLKDLTLVRGQLNPPSNKLVDASSYQEHNGRHRMFHNFLSIGVPTLMAISPLPINHKKLPKHLYSAQSWDAPHIAGCGRWGKIREKCDRVLPKSRCITTHCSGWTEHTGCLAYLTSHRSIPGR